ncbi:MAG: hypothetical protein M1825_006284 [Sarcosagium campestre]|nr:MAG: hypothetical protein M1825_006284 [Sarcosagium campestre]
MLGEFLSKRSNERFLEAYLDQFNFTGQRVDEALRDLLESFRLPGESPLIERIVTSFSEKYCAHSTPEGVADKDAVYVLTYAIIMLNTDQHNPNLKAQNRMSYHDFARNLRGVNGGKDFAPEYLQDIYASIKTNEIILPDEHDNKHAFDYAWKELLVKTSSERDLVLCNTNIFDADMFAATWRPIVATLSYVFLSASDDASFSRVVSGFGQCAQIAARYSLTEALDHIIFSLGTISSLASGAPPNTALNTEVQVGEERIMVSELAVKFGRDFKARLATVVLFRVVLGNEAVIRKGWDHIVRIWLNLFTNSLIPAYFSSNQSSLEMPPIPVQNPSQVIDRGARTNESGIFSAFTSYLSSYAADDPPEPSDEELESTLCTVDCVKACSLEGVFANILLMPPQALKSLVGSLLRQLPEENSPVVIVVKPEVPASGPTNVRRPATKGIVYDPTVVYVLELATVIALRDEEMISTLGKDVAEAIQSVIRDASNVHHIVLSRAIYYLFSLLKGSHHHSFLRAPVILHSISSLEQSVQEKSATYILKGLARCIAEPGALRNEMTNSPDFWSILKALSPTKEGAPIVFEIVESVAVGEFPAITADNYEATIALLNGYASVGSVGAAIEQAQDKVNKKGKPGKSGRVQENDTVARGAKAIGIIYRLTSRVEGLIEKSHLEQNEAWAVYWSPIFRALTKQCVNPCRQIRHQALSSLQRSLLSPSVTSTAHDEWTIIFTEVLFPLIVRLLKPEVYQTDPAGMSETRVQAATLLCKIFLHYLVALSEWEGMLDLWLHILDLMDRLMNSGQGDTLDEAVPESLKNILLVMSDGGFLVPRAQDPRARRLWSETWKRLDRFLPELLRDLFPDEQQPRTTPRPSPSIPQAPLKPLLEQQATAGSASISSSSSLLSNDELSNSAAPFTSAPAATAATGAVAAATKLQSSPPRPSSSSSSSPPPIIPPEPSTISATTTTTEVPQDEGVD